MAASRTTQITFHLSEEEATKLTLIQASSPETSVHKFAKNIIVAALNDNLLPSDFSPEPQPESKPESANALVLSEELMAAYKPYADAKKLSIQEYINEKLVQAVTPKVK